MLSLVSAVKVKCLGL